VNPATTPAEHEALIDYHLERLGRFRARNAVKEAYYEGRQRVKNLGVTLPPALANVDTVVGWPATTVDVLEERLDWQGWTSASGDVFGLDKVYRENDLDVESSLGHTDALLTGVGFVMVGKGDVGEPEVLVTVESPNRVTGEWDRRLRRLSSALSVDDTRADGWDGVEVTAVTLFLPEGDYVYRRSMKGMFWNLDEEASNFHGRGRVSVVMVPNRPRGSRYGGRSEITPAIRSYTDSAVRTMLGMDVHREFYQAPQRYLLGAEEHMFKKGDGSVATGWETVMGRMLAVPRDEDGELPEIGQFTSSDPSPYLEQVRGLAQMVSAEGAIPPNYLGFSTDNPPSADAIRALEARLIKRAERRAAMFGRAWREVAALALLVRDGALPENFSDLSAKWGDPATPTRSAAADEVTKYVGAGVLPADSQVTRDRMGLGPQEQAILVSEQRKARVAQVVAALAAPTPSPALAPPAADAHAA
jgi:hypothetical protein